MAKLITPEQIAAPGQESSHQKAVFVWAALNRETYPHLKLLHAIPNANSHHQVAEGVRGGVPDMCLPWPIYPYHGLYIELKIPGRETHKNGGCTDDQLKWQVDLLDAGYSVSVCYGWKAAVNEILKYLNRNNPHDTSRAS